LRNKSDLLRRNTSGRCCMIVDCTIRSCSRVGSRLTHYWDLLRSYTNLERYGKMGVHVSSLSTGSSVELYRPDKVGLEADKCRLTRRGWRRHREYIIEKEPDSTSHLQHRGTFLSFIEGDAIVAIPFKPLKVSA